MTKLKKFNRIFSLFALTAFIFATANTNAQQQPPKETLRGDGTVIAMGAGKITLVNCDAKGAAGVHEQ